MRTIAKGNGPESLRRHRAAGGTWADFHDAQELRESLVAEQRGLCCYCMCRITADSSTMKIEHWQPRSNYAHRQLAYDNLLAACPGGGGQGPRDQHCDTRKGNRDLKFNPADPSFKIEILIDYRLDGTISSRDAEFNGQLDDILGLNIAKLVNRRKSVLNGIADWLRHEKVRHQGQVSEAVIKRKHNKLLNPTGDTLEPFVQVTIWWLEQHLAR